MSDVIDQANDLAEMHLKAAIKNAKNATGSQMLTGFCQNDCGERTHGAFCSAECRGDFNKRERMRG